MYNNMYMYGYLSIVGWAKAPLAPCPPSGLILRSRGFAASRRMATSPGPSFETRVRRAPQDEGGADVWWARQRTRSRPVPLPTLLVLIQRGIAIQPYRSVANPRKHFHHSAAAAPSLAVTHPPRKNLVLPHEKTVPRFCLRFVATKSHDVNVRRGWFLATRLKRLTQLRISHHAARRSHRAASRHAAQVLQATMDFQGNESARSRHAAQAIAAARFFAGVGRPKRTTCPHFAATRLKFAARP
jgi:hypothetical protein